MTKPEFEVSKGNIAKKLRQQLTLPDSVNMTGAIAKLRFQPEGTTTATELSATISNQWPAVDECKRFDVELDAWGANDLDTPGRYEFQWKITLADSTPLNLPEKSPTEEDPDRDFQIMEVTNVI